MENELGVDDLGQVLGGLPVARAHDELAVVVAHPQDAVRARLLAAGGELRDGSKKG